MPADRKCPACGSSLPVDAPRGLCVECLMQLAEAPPARQPASATDALEEGARATCDMDESPRCQRCGVPVTGQAVGELCANCLLKLALEPPAVPTAVADEPGSASVAPVQSRYFGDYELLRQIGRGGMGVVYEARQISLNRKVALKMILGGDMASSSAVRRFQIEAEAAAKLNHPNIVAIHEFGEREGLPFFSMQRIEGTSLDRELAALGLPSMGGNKSGKTANKTVAREAQGRIAKLVATLARALHYAHEQGIIHCDVKPSNVLIDRHGQPHITDFGIARLLGHDGHLTKSAVMGTPRYMSPEQATGRRDEVTAASDIYSLGVILYELLTGHPPFRAATPNETLRQVMEQEPAAPHDSNPVVNRDLSIICLKCIEKNARHRYASAAELADDLERWTHQEPILARRASSRERLVRWCQRKPAIAALAGSVALLLITVAIGSAVFAWRLSEKEKQREATAKELEASEAIIKSGLDRALDKLWEQPGIPSVTISSEERPALLGNRPRRRALYSGVEERFKFGVYTFEPPSQMAKKFAPLLGNLEESIGDRLRRRVRIDFVIYRSYTNGHEGLLSGEVHFMRMGPASYVLLKRRAGILLIAAQENLIQGGIFTAVTNRIENLEQLRGKPFAFGDAESTFGTHMAKLAFLRTGIRAGDLSTNSHHFPSHKNVVEAVRSGAYAAGAANTIFLGPNFKLLHTFTNVQVRMPFVAREGIDAALAKAFKDAFLAEHSPTVLTNIEPKLTGFREVSDQEYDGLRKEMEEATQFDELKN